MKPNNNKNRYGRFNNGYNGKSRHNTAQINKNTVFDSTGPCGRIRGTAVQLSERYQQASKDALSEDDRVLAENCTQHAEHYTRLYQTAVAMEQERYQNYQAQQQTQQTAQVSPKTTDDTAEEPSSGPAPAEHSDSFAVPAFLKSAPPSFSVESGEKEEAEISAPKIIRKRPARRMPAPSSPDAPDAGAEKTSAA